MNTSKALEVHIKSSNPSLKITYLLQTTTPNHPQEAHRSHSTPSLLGLPTIRKQPWLGIADPQHKPDGERRHAFSAAAVREIGTRLEGSAVRGPTEVHRFLERTGSNEAVGGVPDVGREGRA